MVTASMIVPAARAKARAAMTKSLLMTVTPFVGLTILQSGAGGVTAITQLHIWQGAIGGGAVAAPGAFPVFSRR
jgi:hypothetical protein